MSRALALVLGVLTGIPAIGLATGAGPFPEALGWAPLGNDVSPDDSIRIEWSMLMDSDSVEDAFTLSDGTTFWGAVFFLWTHSTTPPFRSEATPKFTLASTTSYVVFIGASATDSTGQFRLDQDGNGAGGESTDALVWSFMTADADPPAVAQAMPGNGAVNVYVTSNVTIVFDEPMNLESVESAFEIVPAVEGTFDWAGTTRVSFHPSLYLSFGTTYTVRLDGSLAMDAQGNLLDGDGDGYAGGDFSLSFSTEPDTVPPRILGVSPQDGSTGESTSGRIRIAFSESVNRSSLGAGLAVTDGASMWTAMNGTLLWSRANFIAFEDDVVEFDLFPNFPFGSNVRVSLNASLVHDAAGFGLDGNADGVSEGSPADDYTWTFGVELADLTSPTVAQVLPADGAVEVPETTSVTLTFSEPMDRPTVVNGFFLRDGSRTWTKLDGTFAWSQGDQTVSYTPAATIPQGKHYTIVVTGSAKDVNGNALDGDLDGIAGDDFRSGFDTRSEPDATPPHVVSTIPEDGDRDVRPDAEIVITFDDIMNKSATEWAIAIENAAVEPVQGVSLGDFRWSQPAYTLAIRPLAPLEWNTDYRMRISQSARDDAGFAMEYGFELAFHTADWSGRVVGRVVEGEAPVSGAFVSIGNLVTRTEANGTFVFPSVTAGTYELTLDKDGYETVRRVVTIDSPQAGPDGAVDLGALQMSRLQEITPLVALGAMAAVLLILFSAGMLLRRRRDRFVEHFEDLEPEEGEGEH